MWEKVDYICHKIIIRCGDTSDMTTEEVYADEDIYYLCDSCFEDLLLKDANLIKEE